MLRRELDIKNGQITQQSELISKQMELINGLGERLREGNILIGSLHQRLTLADGRESKPAESSKAKTVSPAKPAEPTKAKTVSPAKPGKGTIAPAKTDKPKPKRSFLSRLFRSSP